MNGCDAPQRWQRPAHGRCQRQRASPSTRSISFSVIGRLQDAAQDSEAIHRAQDLRFALDTLLTSELAPRVDASRIVAAGIPGYYSGSQDRVAVFDATGSMRKWLAVFAGGSHSMFTDRGGSGGATLNPQVKEATRALALAFLQTVFDGDEAGLRVWPQRHAAILARFSVAGA